MFAIDRYVISTANDCRCRRARHQHPDDNVAVKTLLTPRLCVTQVQNVCINERPVHDLALNELSTKEGNRCRQNTTDHISQSKQ